jgi:hypothetical protein
MNNKDTHVLLLISVGLLLAIYVVLWFVFTR